MEMNYVLEIEFKSGMTFPLPPAGLDTALYAAGKVITTECVKSISIRRLADGEIEEINSTLKGVAHAVEKNPEADEGMAED